MLDITKLPEDMRDNLRGSFSEESDEQDESNDSKIEALTFHEAFDRAVEYEGLIGYGPTLREWYEFGIKAES